MLDLKQQVQKRVFGLDLLRAFAILFVLFAHSTHYLPEESYQITRPFILDGVNLFFVLSGFLIGRILIREIGEGDFTFQKLKTFWIKRWVRTLPNYFLVATVLFIVIYIFVPTFKPLYALPFFIFSQNLAWNIEGFFPEAWSLSIEEWFYLSSPLMIYGLLKIFPKKVPHVILSVILFVTIFSIGVRVYYIANLEVFDFDTWAYTLRGRVITRMDALMMGVFGAYLVSFFPKTFEFYPKILATVGVVLLYLIHIPSYDDYTSSSINYSWWYFTANAFAVLLMMPFLSQWKMKANLFNYIITYISLISYSLYLVNLTIVHTIGMPRMTAIAAKFVPENLLNSFQVICFFAVSFGLSTLMYKYWEQPFMRWRDRHVK